MSALIRKNINYITNVPIQRYYVHLTLAKIPIVIKLDIFFS